jgi:hypothetical protein
MPRNGRWPSGLSEISIPAPWAAVDLADFEQVAAPVGRPADSQVTVRLPAGMSIRHLRLAVTANTGWPAAAQFSEVEAYRS